MVSSSLLRGCGLNPRQVHTTEIRVGSHVVFVRIHCMDVLIHGTDILIECK